MFKEIMMLLIAPVFVGVLSYLAWDSYKEYKNHH